MQALRAGDERHLPARDRGPVKKYARDLVDARRSVAEFFLPLALLIFVLTIVPGGRAPARRLLPLAGPGRHGGRRLGRAGDAAAARPGPQLPRREPPRRRPLRADAQHADPPVPAAAARGCAPGAAAPAGDRPPSRPPTAGFEPGRELWLARLGNLRNVVRQHLVATQLDAARRDLLLVTDRPLSVLDVGAGQGTQALRLAREGHRVTGGRHRPRRCWRRSGPRSRRSRPRYAVRSPCRSGTCATCAGDGAGPDDVRPGAVPRRADVPRRPGPRAGRAGRGDRAGRRAVAGRPQPRGDGAAARDAPAVGEGAGGVRRDRLRQRARGGRPRRHRRRPDPPAGRARPGRRAVARRAGAQRRRAAGRAGAAAGRAGDAAGRRGARREHRPLPRGRAAGAPARPAPLTRGG